MSQSRAAGLFSALRGRKVVVVGDVMLDRYLWGRVSRVSPEAPVPVVEIEDEAVRLGGAANVAANVRALGAQPILIGLTGPEDDVETRQLLELLDREGVDRAGLIPDPGRQTTVKTRIIAHHQHVVRADRETRVPAEGSAARALCASVAEEAATGDAVILQDYNKGLFSSSVVEEILPVLAEAGIPVTVDPKFERFFDFKGVSVFKPNLKEAEAALGVTLSADESVEEAARHFLHRLEAKNVLITRGERGMCLLEEDGSITHVGTRAKRVFDVSGAGDTVIATLTCMLAAGADIKESTWLANCAAGVVVGEVGVVPITSEALLEAVDPDDE